MKAILFFFLFCFAACGFSQSENDTAKVFMGNKAPGKFQYIIPGISFGTCVEDCQAAIYKRYGIKTRYKGCKAGSRQSQKLKEHNEKIDKELVKLNGQAWFDQLNTELGNCGRKCGW